MALKAVSAPLGSPVGGSGTVGTIPVWGTTTTTLTNSGITDNGSTVTFVSRNLASSAAQTWTLASSTTALNIASGLLNLDTTNNRVGVGTATPLSRLHVTDTGHPLRLDRTDGGEGLIRLQTQGTTRGWIGAGVGKPFNVYNDVITTELFTVLNGGNVGIGTASPGFPLEVVGATQTNNDGIRNVIIRSTATAAALAGGGIGFGGFYDGTTLFINDFAGIQGFKENATAGNWAGALRFTTRINGGSPTERMRIDSTGNVGIGTASPVTGSRLHVAGNAVTASGTTTMTDGFFYIPAAAGAPTGVPTAIAGRVPMYYDTTNDQFYIRNGANWRKVTLT